MMPFLPANISLTLTVVSGVPSCTAREGSVSPTYPEREQYTSSVDCKITLIGILSVAATDNPLLPTWRSITFIGTHKTHATDFCACAFLSTRINFLGYFNRTRVLRYFLCTVNELLVVQYSTYLHRSTKFLDSNNILRVIKVARVMHC